MMTPTPDKPGSEAVRADTYDSWQSIAADMQRVSPLPQNNHPPLSYWESRVSALAALTRPGEAGAGGADAERVAQLIAHRACCGSEHDPANGKLRGYCVVCGIEWPCEYAGKPPAHPQGNDVVRVLVSEREIARRDCAAWVARAEAAEAKLSALLAGAGGVDDAMGVRDTLIVAANNPASHGGLEGLRNIMRTQAARLAALSPGEADLIDLADDVHGRFFWRRSPDKDGNHLVSDESVLKVIQLTCAIAALQAGSAPGEAQRHKWTDECGMTHSVHFAGSVASGAGAEFVGWLETQVCEARNRWAEQFEERWLHDDDVPDCDHFIALWIAERIATRPTAMSAASYRPASEVVSSPSGPGKPSP